MESERYLSSSDRRPESSSEVARVACAGMCHETVAKGIVVGCFGMFSVLIDGACSNVRLEIVIGSWFSTITQDSVAASV